MSAKLEKFNAHDMQDDFFADTAMVGMLCQWPAYHLCWVLNEKYGFDFKCVPEMTIPFDDGNGISHFAVYQYLIPNSSHEYLLYKIKNEATLLLPGQKKSDWLTRADYIILLRTASPAADAAALSAMLLQLDGVSLAQPIEMAQIKHLENLLV